MIFDNPAGRPNGSPRAARLSVQWEKLKLRCRVEMR
jgi:hypothetical protein